MNILQALASRKTTGVVNSDHLPELNSFIDVAIGGKTELLPIEVIEKGAFVVRRPSLAVVGSQALFNYSNGVGRFRFRADCTAVGSCTATFALPKEISVIEKFGEKRRHFRLKRSLPVCFRYAPDGVGYGSFSESSLTDISSVGVGLIVPLALKTGTLIEMRINLPGSGGAFDVLGKLTRPSELQKAGRYSAGIQFETLSPTNANKIGEYITKNQQTNHKRGVATN
jgi:hypothetical protein